MTAHQGHARFLVAAGQCRAAGAPIKADLLKAEWESVDAIRREDEARVARLYARLLREQRAAVLDKLPTLFASSTVDARSTKATPGEIRIGQTLLDASAWLVGIREEFGPLLASIVESGFRTGGIRVGQRLTPVLTPRAEATLADVVAKIQGTTLTTQADVGRIVARAIEQNTPADALARELRASFTTWTETRASAVAETSTVATFEAGQLDGYRAAGVDAKRWLSMRDGNVRPSHDAADGQEVGLDEAFAVGGEALMHPGDPNGSAGNVIRCRCSSTPVVTTKAKGRPWRVERDNRIREDYPALKAEHGHAEAKLKLARREAVSESTVERALYR